jgi:hypothetical protein
MIKLGKISSSFLIVLLLSNIVVSVNVEGCKDIIAVGDATEGDYNLLLKVRDPSRPGLQVLCIVPAGYEYTYNHPWTGKTLQFKVLKKYIGVATKGDTIPNIVKPGMAISESALSFADADTGSNWKNPTRHAWDDFDWIRYACEKADNEEEAVDLMTKDLVDKWHATAVSENLFIVGPKKGFVIEADAFRYIVNEVDGISVMSNYPKELWKTQRHKKLPIARSFDAEKEQYVRKGRTVRLNSLFGVKIVDIGEDWVVARQVPFLKISNKRIKITSGKVEIKLGERETVGDYSVRLLDIDGKKAKISLSYVFKAWEEKMLEYIQGKYGRIDVKQMMSWSRLHGEDLEGLRPMCEDFFPYESAMIYKIPKENYELLSSGWFSANHACSSIYVPIHISNEDIYEPYKTGEVAELSLELLNLYGHDNLTSVLSCAEGVFLNETQEHEQIAYKLIKNNSEVSDFLTIVDTSMQKQAWLTKQMWLKIAGKTYNNDEIFEILGSIWKINYSASLDSMAEAINQLSNYSHPDITWKIKDIAFDICESRINAAKSIGKNVTIMYEDYNNGKQLIEKGDYDQGFQLIKKAFISSDLLLKGQSFIEIDSIKTDNGKNILFQGIFYVLIVVCAIFVLIVLIKKRK